MTILSFPSLIQAAELAELDCIVKPEMYVELSSPVNGILEKLIVEKGSRIKKGQALAQIEASVEIAKVKLATLEAESYNEIKNREIQLQFAKRNEQRVAGLHKKNSVSQIEKDKAETEVALAKVELRKATEKRVTAKLNLELAQTRLELKTIKSPIDGIVVEQYVMVGESVLDRAVMKLAQINPLRVELIAPTEYFGLIKEGMEVEISPERPANKKIKAKVTIVDQLIDPASGSFTVRMALPNPGEQLIGGVNCIAQFNFKIPSSTDTPNILRGY
ncbi:MAG: efflux RND transporter periplasmic adaptor subunit [Methylococcales bacterium]|nr:efflux RND transporter periplasmic adaptor subunit [Methylococcales bacterium]